MLQLPIHYVVACTEKSACHDECISILLHRQGLIQHQYVPVMTMAKPSISTDPKVVRVCVEQVYTRVLRQLSTFRSCESRDREFLFRQTLAPNDASTLERWHEEEDLAYPHALLSPVLQPLALTEEKRISLRNIDARLRRQILWQVGQCLERLHEIGKCHGDIVRTWSG